jgi:hypothetical protein
MVGLTNGRPKPIALGDDKSTGQTGQLLAVLMDKSTGDWLAGDATHREGTVFSDARHTSVLDSVEVSEEAVVNDASCRAKFPRRKPLGS